MGKMLILKNLLIAAFLLLLAIDAFPSTCLLHQTLKNAVKPALVATGLWQGPWDMFAPNVDKLNSRITATIRFADGSSALWGQPNWPDLSAFERFVRSREAEYFDGVQWRTKRELLQALSDYLAGTVAPPPGSDSPVEAVQIQRHWKVIPAPDKEFIPRGTPVEIDSHEILFDQFYPK